MNKLKVIGNNSHQYIKLEGKKSNPEPPEVSIRFPLGSIAVTRLDDGKYWIHINTRRVDGEGMTHNNGKIIDARIDNTEVDVNKAKTGHLKDPNTYHMAILISKGTGEIVA